MVFRFIIISYLIIPGAYNSDWYSEVVSKDLIIDVGDSEVSLALLEDKQLIELNKEKRNVKFSVGDIYLGKVKKIMPGLNAAFINVGY